jgi:hypothetical protein
MLEPTAGPWTADGQSVWDRRGVPRTIRVIETDGARLALTSLEVSVLRHALELVREDPRALCARLSEGGQRRTPTARHVDHVIAGLIDHLLCGRGVLGDPPDVSRWRLRVLAAAAGNGARGCPRTGGTEPAGTIPLPAVDAGSGTCAVGG